MGVRNIMGPRSGQEIMNNKAKCQCCGETSGVEPVVVFNVEFVVCAYCRGDALETLQLSYTWERENSGDDVGPGEHGGAVVFDGGREIYRRGYGLSDHVG